MVYRKPAGVQAAKALSQEGPLLISTESHPVKTGISSMSALAIFLLANGRKNYTRLLNPTLHVPFCSKLGDVQCFVCFYYSQGSSLIEAGVEVWSSDPMGKWGHLEGCFFLTFFQYCIESEILSASCPQNGDQTHATGTSCLSG